MRDGFIDGRAIAKTFTAKADEYIYFYPPMRGKLKVFEEIFNFNPVEERLVTDFQKKRF